MIFRKRVSITERCVLCRSIGISATASAEGMFLVDAKGGRLYELNGTGRAIWEGLSQPTTLDDLCGRMINQFSADDNTIRRDISHLLDEFQRAKLIQVSTG